MAKFFRGLVPMNIDVVKYQFRTDIDGMMAGQKQIGCSHVLAWKLTQIALMKPHENRRLKGILKELSETVVNLFIDVALRKVLAPLKPADSFQAA